MDLYGVVGACGVVLLLGACEVHVGSAPPAPPSPGRPAPAPPPPIQHPAAQAHLAAPAPPPAPANAPPVAPHPVALHLSGRIVHPPPLENAGTARLNVQALRIKLRIGRKCGPRESTPGHWIHIDCNQYTAVTSAKPPSTRKIHLMLGGSLRLDSAVGHPGGGLDRSGKIGDNQLPDAVDHRNDGTEGPIKDQGQVGSCTAFSLSSVLDNAIHRQNKAETTSPLHIWSHYGYPDMKTAGDDNLNKPIATWDTWPYDARVACELDQGGEGDCGPFEPPVSPGSGAGDAQVQAKIKDADSKGHWKISEYDEIHGDPDTIAAQLASGADVWLSMRIGSTWMNPRGDTVADWTEDQVEGGHAILLAGYRHKNGQRQFLVHNSWGKDWGDGGYAWISDNAVKQFIKHSYKVVLVDSSGPPPPPTDPNALTDDDCGEDQLVDAVSGQCAQMCPDDSRPSNGQCGAAVGKHR